MPFAAIENTPITRPRMGERAGDLLEFLGTHLRKDRAGVFFERFSNASYRNFHGNGTGQQSSDGSPRNQVETVGESFAGKRFQLLQHDR
jgi:hypothetical protein